MLRKEVDLYMEGSVQFQKVNILIFFKSLFYFFKEDLVFSDPAGSLRKQSGVSLPFPAALGLPYWTCGQGSLDPDIGSGQPRASFPSLYRGIRLPFLHPSPDLVEKVGPA